MKHRQQTPFRRRHTLVVIVLLLAANHAFAGISAQRSWAKVSQDGSRVFAMIPAQIDSYEQTNPKSVTLPSGQTGIVHKLFTRSGVYDAKSLELIWPINWFAQEYDIQLSTNGSVVVRRNRFAVPTGWALAFYRDGMVFKTYTCDELLTSLKSERFLPYETWDWHTRWYDQFTTANNRLSVSTARREFWIPGIRIDLGLQEQYEFDFVTGQIVGRQVSGRWIIWSYVIIACAALFGLPLFVAWTFRFFLKWRRRKARGFPVLLGSDARE